jgi:hypothetical protein
MLWDVVLTRASSKNQPKIGNRLYQRAHRRDRSAPWAARARTARASPTSSTVASG